MSADDVAILLHRAAEEHDEERRGWLLAEAAALAGARGQEPERSLMLDEIARLQAGAP